MISLKRALAAAAIAAGVSAAVVPQTNAQSVDLDSLLDGTAAKQVTVKFGCGDPAKVNCSEIVGLIAAKLPANIHLEPDFGGGSVESAAKVCKGDIQMAIGQTDAISVVAKNPRCASAFERVATPPYSYVGYMAVLASNSASTLHDLTKGKDVVRVVAGGVTSGGNITMQALKKSDPKWDAAISIVNEKVESALQDLADGKITGVFVMDAPKSPFIDAIKAKVDSQGKPLFKLVEVNPYNKMFDAEAVQGYKRYTSESVTVPGWLRNHSLDTVGTPAMVIANSAWRQTPEGGKAYTAVRAAVEAANADILKATGSDKGWKPSLGR